MKLHHLFLPLFLCWGSFGESAVPDETRASWRDAIPILVNQQHQHTLAAVEALLERFPPEHATTLERQAALLLLDNVLFDPEAAEKPAVQAFFVERTKKAAAALREARVTRGARIWKLYNHGFIARTASVTIAFDLVSGRHLGNDGFVLPDELLEDLARQCDLLFVSHFHPDHAVLRVTEIFFRNGKPVVAPEGLWKTRPVAEGIVYLQRAAAIIQTIPIREGAYSLKVINYPGHQGDSVTNNVVVITTPDGLTFAHTGDQSNARDFEWVDSVSKTQKIDVLLPNCWGTDLPRLIAGFNPALVIPGHENEISHTLDQRKPSWLVRERLGDMASRAVLMAWGECYDYTAE